MSSSASSTCTVTLSTAPAASVSVALSGNTTLLTVPASVTVPASTTTATFTVKAGTITTAQTAVVTATLNGTSKTASVLLTTVTAVTCPCTIWKPTAVPTLITDPETVGVELGMMFKSAAAGYVTGVRFYKGPKNTGTHIGHLWTNGGTLLATVTFSGETSSGWQQANFATPVAIAANTTYLISYWASAGYYTGDVGYFSGGVDNGPMHAMSSNDFYTYTKGAFPTSTWQASNYWVDAVFNGAASTASTVVAYGASATTSKTAGVKSALSMTASSATTAVRSAGRTSTVRSLSCPNAVQAGSSFTCELSLASQGVSSATDIALASSSGDVRLPATLTARSGRTSLKFHGAIDAAATQSVITLTAGDEDDAAETQIAVLASSAPVFSLPTTLLVKAGEPVNFRVSAQDPAGLAVQLAASKLPVGATFQPSSGRFDWTPALNQEGVFTPVFSAVNSTGFSASAKSEITVGSGKPVISASAKAACSPGAIATLPGQWLSLTGVDLSDPTGASRQLGGTAVHVNGSLASVVYASPDRVDFQCPNAAAGTALAITVETADGTSTPLHTTMLAANPAILLAQSSNPEQGQITLSGTDRLATARDAQASGEPALTDDLVSIRAMGLGAIDGAAGTISVQVGGLDAQVQSVVPAPDAAGIFLVTVRIPAAAPSGDAVPVQLELISATGTHLSSNQVTMAIE